MQECETLLSLYVFVFNKKRALCWLHENITMNLVAKPFFSFLNLHVCSKILMVQVLFIYKIAYIFYYHATYLVMRSEDHHFVSP